jgi:hypothetical protein
MLGLGAFSAPILVIAQNPNEISDDDYMRLAFAEAIGSAKGFKLDNDELGKLIEDFYRADFGDSLQFVRLARVFGKNWLSSGSFYYTNAVRCRTEFNNTPSQTMIDSCSVWTKRLLAGRSAVITMGVVAATQVWGSSVPRLMTLTYVRPAASKQKVIALNLSHPVIWPREDAEDIRAMVKTIIDKVVTNGG